MTSYPHSDREPLTVFPCSSSSLDTSLKDPQVVATGLGPEQNHIAFREHGEEITPDLGGGDGGRGGGRDRRLSG